MQWQGEYEYSLYYGLSIVGVIYLYHTIKFYFSVKGADPKTLDLAAIKPIRKFFEVIFMVVFGLATAWFLYFYFVPVLSEEPLLEGVPAQIESSSVEGWYKLGIESDVVRFSLPQEAVFEWAMYRQDLETGPTKALIYTAISKEGDELYKVTLEWVIDEKGERLLTPDFDKEAEFIKEFYAFDNNAIVNDMQFRDIAMKKYTFKSNNQKLVGVWFEKDGVFYDVTVWPNMPGLADEELNKILETFEFTN